MRRNLAAILICLFSCSGQCALASGYPAYFYKDVNTISVSTSVEKKESGIAGFLIDAYSSGGLPFDQAAVGNWFIEALQATIKVPKEINFVISQGQQGLGIDGTKLFVNVSLQYWGASLFSPKLNHDVVVITLKKERVISRYTGSETQTFDDKMDAGPYLISVPEEKSEQEHAVKNEITKIVGENLKYVNCANGGSCEGIK